MDCKECQKKLQAFIDGELSPEDAEICQDHISECDECRGILAELREVNRLGTKALGGVFTGEGFLSSIVRKIKKDRAGKSGNYVMMGES